MKIYPSSENIRLITFQKKPVVNPDPKMPKAQKNDTVNVSTQLNQVHEGFQNTIPPYIGHPVEPDPGHSAGIPTNPGLPDSPPPYIGQPVEPDPGHSAGISPNPGLPDSPPPYIGHPVEPKPAHSAGIAPNPGLPDSPPTYYIGQPVEPTEDHFSAIYTGIMKNISEFA